MFLGDDLPAWLLLAFGGALCMGTALALFRPPPAAVLAAQDDELDGDEPADADDRPRLTTQSRPPLARSLIMITIGVLCAGWALASLINGHG